MAQHANSADGEATEEIAQNRHTTTGAMGLAPSRPNHENTFYSRERLAQLTEALERASPNQKINVQLVSQMSPGDVVGDTSKGPTVFLYDVRRPPHVDTSSLNDGTEEPDLSGMDAGRRRVRSSSPSHREHRSSSPSSRRSRTGSLDRNVVEIQANRFERGKLARRLLGAIMLFVLVGVVLFGSYFEVSRWSAVVNNNNEHAPPVLSTVTTAPTNAAAASEGDDNPSPRWMSSISSIFSRGKTVVVADSAIKDASLGDVAVGKEGVHSTGGSAGKTDRKQKLANSSSSADDKKAGRATGGGGAGAGAVTSGRKARKGMLLRHVRRGTTQWLKKARHAVGSWRALHKEDGEAFLSGDK